MNIIQTSRFKKVVKKLDSNQKSALDKAIKEIIKDPSLGQSKVGDLSGTLVYKFDMAKQLSLLVYTYQDGVTTLTLLVLGVPENFYLDLKATV
tara:strand:+ start:1504 stop:1782 length:279 start_codon:yes stop_codon:yes gene_type:complete